MISPRTEAMGILENSGRPLSPKEIAALKQQYIPGYVYNAFNLLIARNFNGRDARVLQEDVVSIIMSKVNVSRAEIIANKWLDVEDVYRKQGWRVTYDKPGYCETGEPFYVFSKPSNN